MALAVADGRPPRRLRRGRPHSAAAARRSPRPQARRRRRRALAAAGTIDAAALAAALGGGAALDGAELVADARDGRRFVLLARDAPPASAAYRILLGDAPPGGAPALREPAATPLVAPWGGGGAPPACVAADGARLLFRRDADDGVTWIECDLARGSFTAAKYRAGSAAAAVREFLGR